jgi:glutamate/aspartate transport system permease protein
MAYNWSWDALLQPVATGENSTYLGWVIDGLVVTSALTITAWLLALLLGTTLGIVRAWPGRLGDAIGAVYVSVFRNIPLIVQFFIWYFVVPEILPTAIGDWIKSITPMTQVFIMSVLALGFFTSARICEQMRAGIGSLSRGQLQASLSLGFTTMQSFRHILLPQAFRKILPPLTSEFLIISKNSAVASTIGLLELSGQARQLVDYTAQPYESFIVVTVAYMLLNFVILQIMGLVRRRAALPGMVRG